MCANVVCSVSAISFKYRNSDTGQEHCDSAPIALCLHNLYRYFVLFNANCVSWIRR